MIDIKTGIFKIDDDLIFSPNFSYDDFKKTPYFKGQDSIRMIYLDNKQRIDGKTYIVSFFFREEKIYMISLINCDDSISESDEQRRKEIHDKILFQKGIENGKGYSWGKIKSEYDTRNNVSCINIFYRV